MDIEFSCGKCGQKVVVEEAGIGMTLPCPGCGQDLIVPSVAKPAIASAKPVIVAAVPNEVTTNVKQGAALGGWICLIIGVAVMFIPLPTWFIYGPLFLASFILAIVAMSQRRVASGVVLLLFNVVGVPILWFVAFTLGLVTWSDALSKASQRGQQEASTPNPLFSSGNQKSTSTPLSQPTGTTTVTAAKYAELDSKNGFRDYKLGTPVNQFKDIKLAQIGFHSDPDEKNYKLEVFEHGLGSFLISDIMLTFDTDLLKEITVWAQGKENVAGLRESLVQAYGEPAKEGFISDDLVWRGNKVVLRFHAKDEASGWATFRSTEVEEQLKADAERRAKEGAAKAAKEL